MPAVRSAALILVAAAGCVGDLDPRWQLDHDRIVAVRATPSRIPPGARAGLDGLVAVKNGVTAVAQPLGAEVAPTAPAALAGSVIEDANGWAVIAPSEDVLVQARVELGLAAGVPVPLDVGIAFASSTGAPLVAIKTVFLDDSADNPTIGAVTLAGAPVGPDDSLSVPFDLDVPLTVDEDTPIAVSWLTSCGTLTDDDEHAATLQVQPKDSTSGQLAVVVRDTLGGVAWQLWPITTTGVPVMP
jgi:hypothetical protein